MALHKCTSCGEEKGTSEFPLDHRPAQPRPRTKCKACVRVWQRKDREAKNEIYNARYRLRRKRYKRDLIVLLGGCCVRCEGVFPDCCYDFHHTDPSKKEFDATVLLNLTKEKQLVEIKKCVLLCANCHRKEHFYDEEFDHS